jgi:hypothetical protein
MRCRTSIQARAVTLAACVLTGASAHAAAGAALPEDMLGTLSRCDAGFFQQLARHAPALKTVPTLLSQPGWATFKVEDRSDVARSHTRFDPPIRVGALDVVAYFDEYVSLGPDEAVLAWGWVLRAPLAQVLKQTQHLIWDADRLQQDGDVHARSERWDHGQPASGWIKINTPGGADAQADTAERILQIEASDQDARLTRFGCSLRGTVTRELIRASRPDLGDTTRTP